MAKREFNKQYIKKLLNKGNYLITVNDTIRMYKKWNIKMLIFVHSFCYTY